MTGMDGPGRSRGRGRGRFGTSAGLRPVSEASRLSVSQQLDNFQRSDETSKHALEFCSDPRGFMEQFSEPCRVGIVTTAADYASLQSAT